MKQERITKAAARYNAGYDAATAEELRDVYGRCSIEKARAFAACKDAMRSLNGWGMRILSHNTYSFTVGWLYKDADGATRLAVETMSNSYRFPRAA